MLQVVDDTCVENCSLWLQIDWRGIFRICDLHIIGEGATVFIKVELPLESQVLALDRPPKITLFQFDYCGDSKIAPSNA